MNKKQFYFINQDSWCTDGSLYVRFKKVYIDLFGYEQSIEIKKFTFMFIAVF